MEDIETRRRFRYVTKLQRDLNKKVEVLREMLHSMRLEDAEARADLKIATGNLKNAADALANATQAIQARELAQKTEREESREGTLEKWWPRIVFALLAIVAALVGVKEVLPALVKLLTGT